MTDTRDDGGIHLADGPLTTSERHLIRLAKRLRFERRLLEFLLLAIVGGSVAAIGAVHPQAYVPLWLATLLTAVVALSSVATARRLRRRLGPTRLEIHPSGLWIILNCASASGSSGWTFDLAKPLLPRPPLLWPGLAFTALVLAQLVPLPPSLAAAFSPAAASPSATGDWPPPGLLGVGSWRPLTVSVADTLRGLAFLLTALLVHICAAVALRERLARQHLRRAVATLALIVATVALVQMSTGTARIYGYFEPLEGGTPYGPFVNRNHFATWMLLASASTFALLDQALRAYRHRVGSRPNIRRRLVALQSAEGTAVVYALIPAAAAVASLLASTSRGGILAFVFGLGLALLAGHNKSRGASAWALALAFVAMTLAWFGVDRIAARFSRTETDAPARTRVWVDAVSRMNGRWITGSGFNTFGLTMSRVAAWRLPAGATPWPEAVRSELESGARVGYLSVDELAGLEWYREAHNDYVQLLVETGLVGLGLALWGALAALSSVRRNPWVLAALAGTLLHAIVDFGLQIPAIALLFAVVAALQPNGNADSAESLEIAQNAIR